jgi:putative phosphoesterase
LREPASDPDRPLRREGAGEDPRVTTVGLISDTHDLMRPEALEALAGVERILHAGDVCRPDVLERLARLAPVSLVRGNCDYGDWAHPVPLSDTWDIDGLLVHAVHDLATLDIDPSAAGVSVVLSGHSHSPLVERRGGVLYVNPGSAGPRRFRLPVSLGKLHVGSGAPRVELIKLG